jgi:hypothetical protein
VSTITNKLLLGQLVIDLGWVSENQFKRCLDVAIEIGAPIGRVLRAEAHISDTEMQSLIVAQSMIRDGYLTIELAKKALSISSWWSVSLEHVLSAVGVASEDVHFCNRLGELLVSAGWIERQALSEAISSSKIVNVPLGKHLVAKGYLSKQLMQMVLDLQTHLRNGQISRDNAIAAMKAMPSNLVDAAGTNGSDLENLKLGQLLANAGIITHADVINVLELAQINGRPLGEMLLIFGLISQRMLESALRLQKLTMDRSITAREAVYSLYRTFGVSISGENNKTTIVVPTTPVDNSKMTVSAFLQLVQGLDNESLKKLTQSGMNLPDSRKFLDSLDYNLVRAATRCAFLVKTASLTLEQAAFAFHHCRLNNVDLEEFLFVSGWVSLEGMGSIALIQNDLPNTLQTQAA